MPLNTLDRSPPPFFRQGPSALARLLFFASLAVLMMALDTRLTLTPPLRTALATALEPVERLALAPGQVLSGANDYVGGVSAARASAEAARAQMVKLSERAQQADALAQENARLRGLLELRERVRVLHHPAEIIYDAPDPYTRRVVIDRGSQQGVKNGSPVINEAGVLGQVTRVYPLTAEVTLVTDRESVIPVLVLRTGVRSVAAGDPASAGMELRFVATNADIRAGDMLHTSGLDGVYPAGFPVGTVRAVERRTQNDFARIVVTPAAPPDGVRHVLVLDPVGEQLPQAPAPAASAASAAASGNRRSH